MQQPSGSHDLHSHLVSPSLCQVQVLNVHGDSSAALDISQHYPNIRAVFWFDIKKPEANSAYVVVDWTFSGDAQVLAGMKTWLHTPASNGQLWWKMLVGSSPMRTCRPPLMHTQQELCMQETNTGAHMRLLAHICVHACTGRQGWKREVLAGNTGSHISYTLTHTWACICAYTCACTHTSLCSWHTCMCEHPLSLLRNHAGGCDGTRQYSTMQQIWLNVPPDACCRCMAHI